jgi:hypothetical protein
VHDGPDPDRGLEGRVAARLARLSARGMVVIRWRSNHRPGSGFELQLRTRSKWQGNSSDGTRHSGGGSGRRAVSHPAECRFPQWRTAARKGPRPSQMSRPCPHNALQTKPVEAPSAGKAGLKSTEGARKGPRQFVLR